MKHFTLLIIFFSFLAPTLASAKPFRHKLYCSMRASRDCKNLKTFLLDYKDGCAGPTTNCRKNFCLHNCFKDSAPTENATQNACRTHCDPQEFTHITNTERRLFYKRFENKHSRRKREVSTFISNVLSNQIWCEGECDYDETNPTCKIKGAKRHWQTCVTRCFFIKDIKEHAEKCLGKLAIAPKPKKRLKRLTVLLGKKGSK